MTEHPDISAIQSISGAKIMIRLKDPSYRKDGATFYMAELADWSELETLPITECKHLHTACNECARQWAQDHFVKVVLVDGEEFGVNDVPGVEPLFPEEGS